MTDDGSPVTAFVNQTATGPRLFIVCGPASGNGDRSRCRVMGCRAAIATTVEAVTLKEATVRAMYVCGSCAAKAQKKNASTGNGHPGRDAATTLTDQVTRVKPRS